MRHAREDYNRIQDPAGLIPHDEPVFLIRAQDRCSAPAIRMYAELAALVGADSRLVTRCMEWADEVEAWQAEQRDGIVKVPDIPAEVA